MTGKLLDYKSAQLKVLAEVHAGTMESVRLLDAFGRILAKDLVADWDLPRYSNSAMDGFVIRVSGCEVGKELAISGTISAGSNTKFEVLPETVVKIMTGAAIPPGADAVIPVEQIEILGEKVRLLHLPVKGEHIRYQGEDLKKGALVLASGVRLTAAELSLLATFGLDRVDVYRKPKVAVLATGNELVRPGEDLGPNQIYDSNTTLICAAVAAAGGEAIPLGIALDDRDLLRQKIKAGLKADILITVAGASVGEYDLLQDVLGELSAEEIFWGVSIKPGKPTGFCLCENKPVFCLPGNPVSAFVTFELFVRPALMKMSGRASALAETVRLPLLKPMKKKAARTLFARVKLVHAADGLSVTSAGSQQTGIMTSLVNADGLAVLPDGQAEFTAGEQVEVILLNQS